MGLEIDKSSTGILLFLFNFKILVKILFIWLQLNYILDNPIHLELFYSNMFLFKYPDFFFPENVLKEMFFFFLLKYF